MKNLKLIPVALLSAILLFTACRKNQDINVNHYHNLPFAPVSKSIPDKTILNWAATSYSPMDTIFWLYNPDGTLSGAKQGGMAILNIHYQLPYSTSNPNILYTNISASCGGDSSVITVANGYPIHVDFYDMATKTKSLKEYIITYNSSGELSIIEEKLNDTESIFTNIWSTLGVPDSVIIGETSLVQTIDPMHFEDFSYSHDISNLDFLPFVLSLPQPHTNLSNVSSGFPLCTNIMDAYLWSRLFPFTNKKLLNGFSQLGSGGFANKNFTQARSIFTQNSITYNIGGASVTTIFK